ncbi:hypothetical protein QWY28_14200 [Nocardioides sp. SOB77]|uniref:Uncharacterized protein n=1 Tax=Nocardioides oceani TaxID=3058369 RepID=A0ABT8FI23_9ACTN|nr:hypothetical protein [Nocardioides oceani]MDN4174110.1 hypothetical protein [Nocardioides oceani]
MRADDFPDYLAARWVPLVRVVVLLGASPALAHRVVAVALGSARRDWRELRTVGDLDGDVLGAVLRTLADARKQGLDRTGPDEAPHEPHEPDVLREALAALGALPERERTRLVVAALLGRGTTDHPALLDGVRRAAATVRVGPAPAPEELPTRLGPRRSGRLVALGLAVVLALVAATYAVGAVRSPDEPEPGPDRPGERLGPLGVVDVENPVPVTWWVDGVLHLPSGRTDLAGVVDLVAVGGGVVVADEEQRVVHVDREGARTLLGTQAPGTGLAAQHDSALVAWVESDGTVVLHDVLAGDDVDRQRLDIFEEATGEVVAVDGSVVHLASAFGDVRWAAGDDSTTVAQPPVLLDRAAGTVLARQGPTRVRVEQPFFSVGHDLPGRGGSLSPDGEVVLTSVADERSAYGTVRLHESRTGDRLPTGLGAEDVVLASAFGGDGTVTHVVARLQDLPRTDDYVRSSFSGRLELRTCRLADGRCRTDATVPASGGVPLLAAP